jgi:hypothetical protein
VATPKAASARSCEQVATFLCAIAIEQVATFFCAIALALGEVTARIDAAAGALRSAASGRGGRTRSVSARIDRVPAAPR